MAEQALRTRPRPPRVGDVAPWFVQRSTNNEAFMFNALAGRYVVVCLFGTAGDAIGRAVLAAFLGHGAVFDDTRATLVGVSVDPADERLRRVRQRLPGFRCLWDADHRASRMLGASRGPGSPYWRHTLVLDQRLRVLAEFDIDEPVRHVAQVVAFVEGLPVLEPIVADTQARHDGRHATRDRHDAAVGRRILHARRVTTAQ